MANQDAAATGIRHVRCPRCHGLLQEPAGAPVYQCGGCGATLRAKNRSGGDAQGAASSSASPSTSRSGGLPPPPPPRSGHSGSRDVASTSRSTTPTPDARSSEQQHHGSGDVASTSSATPEVTTSSRRRATETTTGRSEAAGEDPASASKRATDEGEHDQQSTASRGAYDKSESRRQRGTYDDDAERNASVSPGPGVRVNLPGGGAKDAGTTFESPDAAARKKKHSQFRDRQELAPNPAHQAAQPQQQQPSRDGGKVRSPPPPPRHELLQAEAEDLAPLRRKILKTVDELKGDLSQLFSKSPDLNPTTRARARARPPPRRLPEREGYAPRGDAASSTLPARPRHAAAVANDHEGHAVKPGRVAAASAPAPPPRRGLPSRRYRRCRADLPCHANAPPRACHHHGCCCCRHHHGTKPAECSSCRGHCGRPSTAREPPSAPRDPPAAAPKRRPPPPRHHCRPVLKGAPFIICSSCFRLVQVPADFAVSTNRLRRLRCGSCSAVLTYSYRDPGRKKPHHQYDDSVIDQLSTDGSNVQYGHGGKGCHAQPPDGDPFAPFVDNFGLSSYSTTEDEQPPPLHVSRNTSFDTLDGLKLKGGVGRLHRLMGYGSASELLRRSPDLYERSFDERTTPDYDRKGKGVCIDVEDDDSDDEDSGVLVRSAARRGAVWPLPGTLGDGIPGPGAIRINS